MTINRSKTAIVLTEGEQEAIKTVANLAHDIFFGLNDNEVFRFNGIMRASWSGDDDPNIEVGINDLYCLLDDLQKNIDEFNKLLFSYNMEEQIMEKNETALEMCLRMLRERAKHWYEISNNEFQTGMSAAYDSAASILELAMQDNIKILQQLDYYHHCNDEKNE